MAKGYGKSGKTKEERVKKREENKSKNVLNSKNPGVVSSGINKPLNFKK